ncbi:tRNA preQ1(34) S-adenosylmethionine ribosyltransferase-isomerase QueA [Coralliovum pocilloporae]|uniref:tRNA preQ1(34) S-adenosylmethionine ribosyltransferase-isomerase QueA n=1 Tax=Coralliovum pocilloporae TaxID=3066369 RepID=UPI003306D30A
MRVDQFDFELPEERIALRPVHPKHDARMLIVSDDPLSDRTVVDLPDLLQPGDALVFNDTRVIPAELTGYRCRADARAKVTFNLHKRETLNSWLAFARPAKKLAVGDRVEFGPDFVAEVSDKGEAGEVLLTFDVAGQDLDVKIAGAGHIPLPPYIGSKRPEDEQDAEDYQTIYAEEDGAVAAPTAGLHFTDELFAALDARGIERHFITLHVGAGTFLPVKADDTDGHKMHSEWGEITPAQADALNAVRARGGRLVSVGTTSLRLLESAADDDGTIRPFAGDTDIFITPGYRFKAVDVLMTNFHLPRSTLFMLVSAFAGFDAMRQAYTHAIKTGYRFYSYGDSSLLFRKPLEARS